MARRIDRLVELVVRWTSNVASRAAAELIPPRSEANSLRATFLSCNKLEVIVACSLATIVRASATEEADRH